MQALLHNLHWLIILYAGWQGYEIYETNNQVILNLQSKLQKSQKEFKKRSKELEVVKQYEDQKEEASKQFKEVEAEFQVIKKKLPSNFNHIQNKQMFINIADKLNIKDAIVDDNKLKEENKGFYFLKKYKLKGNGTFLQFLIMLERVSESERLFNINSLVFKEGKSAQRGRFSVIGSEIIVEAYRYNENYEKELERKRKEAAAAAKNGGKAKKKRRRKRR